MKTLKLFSIHWALAQKYIFSDLSTMQTEETLTNSSRFRTRLIILIILLSAFMIYYTIMALLSPGKKLKEISAEFAFKQNGKNIVDEKIFSDSAYLSLLKEKAYLQARISMAETDSIYLTFNLPDSIVNLEISGVVVHTAKIKNLKMSSILEKGNEYIISSILSSPLTIANEFSSIVKEPLMISMAPKDTSEYQPDIMPDTADYEPVNYILEMHNGLRVYVYQDEKLSFGEGIHFPGFDMRDRLRNALRSMKNVMFFKIPEYHPFIKIRLPRADAKIIYRAIPRHGQVAVYR